MKKITAVLAALASLIIVGLTAVPANAVTANGTCTYDSAGVNPVATKMVIVDGVGGRHDVTGSLWNDGENRTWDWKMYHNGDVSAEGTKTGGGWEVNRTMIDFNGADVIEFRVQNRARTVDCWAKAIVG